VATDTDDLTLTERLAVARLRAQPTAHPEDVRTALALIDRLTGGPQ
jgi:hypothetical protein